MKDYKRLTERDEFGNADIIGVGSEILASTLDFDELNKLTFALNKFADLEDKIESGELVVRNEYLDRLMGAKDISGMTDKEIQFFAKHNARVRENTTAEIARLTAENAELRARLSKMETVEKELRERLDNAVELPSVRRDCELTQIVYRNNYGNIEEETYFHDCYYGQCHDVRGDVYAEARLEELKGG